MTKAKADNSLQNPLTLHLGYQLRRASNAMIVDLGKRLSHLDLTVVKGSVLLLIQSNPNITQIKIAKALAIKRANMAPIIASLEEQGLVSRSRVDGRSQGLKLTEKGEQLTGKVSRLMDEHEKKFAAKISRALVNRVKSEFSLIWEGDS